MSIRDMFYPSDKVYTETEEVEFYETVLTVSVTEEILIAMEDKGITKEMLAERMGKRTKYITEILNGDRRMTLGVLAHIFFILGLKLTITTTE